MTDFETSPLLDVDKSLRLGRPAIGDIPVAFGSMALGALGLGAEVAYKAYKKAPEVADSLISRLIKISDAISVANHRRFDEFYAAIGAQTEPVPPYVLPDNSEFVASFISRPTISAVQEIPRV